MISILKMGDIMRNLFIVCMVSLIIMTGCQLNPQKNSDDSNPSTSAGTPVNPVHESGFLLLYVVTNNMFSKVIKKTIEPNVDMNIDHYSISGVGPYGSNFCESNITTNAFSKKLDAGDWVLTVDSFNASNIAVAMGSTNLNIQPILTNTAAIFLQPYFGNGTLKISVQWPETMPGPGIAGYLVSGVNTNYMSFNLSGNTATYQCSTITAGYYMLFLNLYTAQEKIWGAATSVRILSGQSTAGTFNITNIRTTNGITYAESGNISVQIIPDLQNPDKIELLGVREQVPFGSNITITATNLSSLNCGDCYWYLNGDMLFETNNTLIIGSNLTEGEYRLDFVSIKNNIISSESTNFSIKAFDELLFGPVMTFNLKVKDNETILDAGIVKAIFLDRTFGILSSYENGMNNFVSANILRIPVSKIPVNSAYVMLKINNFVSLYESLNNTILMIDRKDINNLVNLDYPEAETWLTNTYSANGLPRTLPLYAPFGLEQSYYTGSSLWAGHASYAETEAIVVNRSQADNRLDCKSLGGNWKFCTVFSSQAMSGNYYYNGVGLCISGREETDSNKILLFQDNCDDTTLSNWSGVSFYSSITADEIPGFLGLVSWDGPFKITRNFPPQNITGGGKVKFYIDVDKFSSVPGVNCSILDINNKKRTFVLDGSHLEQWKLCTFQSDDSGTTGDPDFDYGNITGIEISGIGGLACVYIDGLRIYGGPTNAIKEYSEDKTVYNENYAEGNTSSWGAYNNIWITSTLNYDINGNVHDGFTVKYLVFGGDYISSMSDSFLAENKIWFLK